MWFWEVSCFYLGSCSLQPATAERHRGDAGEQRFLRIAAVRAGAFLLPILPPFMCLPPAQQQQGYHTWFSLQAPETKASHQNSFSSASQKPLSKLMHPQWGKWRHRFPQLVLVFLEISWILKGKALGFADLLWAAHQVPAWVLQRALTGELQYAIALMMDYECFLSSERRKDIIWPSQAEEKAAGGAGAAWEQGTEKVTWAQPHLAPHTLQKLQPLRKGQNCVITGHELWHHFRVTDRYAWHGKADSHQAESHCRSQAWQHRVACKEFIIQCC